MLVIVSLIHINIKTLLFDMEYKKEDIQIGNFRNNEWKVLNGIESIHTTLNRLKTEIDWCRVYKSPMKLI